MSKDQQLQVKSWLRGDLPTWVGVALTSIIAWGGKQAYDTLNAAVARLNSHEVRITVLEAYQGRRADAGPFGMTNAGWAPRHNPAPTTPAMGKAN